WYTPAGARAANWSDIAERPGPRPPPSLQWALGEWMTGPFHRVSILNPRLHSAGFGSWCDGQLCVAALNVVAGATPPELGTVLPTPVRFPPADATIDMNSSQGEWPNPLTSC